MFDQSSKLRLDLFGAITIIIGHSKIILQTNFDRLEKSFVPEPIHACDILYWNES